ncbi:MFS transporter [Paenibacillus sp. KQZ6P-2]|uniref:MFS transporter n=1 Tax=Paenibacillus mangrovi TaxID=2931978 RepID=A0A9X2B3I3_9BACL|nr:MFS transporter [Paenibacillus mangrovi]MCJ8013649.1 MFS transporter [Paenibacillus mangrovi]
MKRIVWLGCMAYFMVGLATVVFGALLPEMLRDYGLGYSSGGQLVFAQFAGFFIGVNLAPRLSTRLGYQKTICIGMLSLIFVHALLLCHPYWFVVLGLAVLNGFGFGMTQTAIGTFLLEAVDQNGAIMMSRLEVAFGIGALFMPLASGLFIAQHSWIWSFAVVVLFAIINLVLWSNKFVNHLNHLPGVSQYSLAKKQENDVITAKTQLSKLAFFIAFVFLYVGIETSIVNFLPSLFVQHLGLGSSEATLSVTFFWISMVIGRLFSGYIAEKINYYRYLFFSTVGAALFLVCIALAKGTAVSFAMVFMIGLFLSGIFAILIVFANRVFAGNTKQITSILIASGGVGGALLPLVIGWSLERYQATVTIWVIVGCTLLLLGCLFRIRKIEKERTKVNQRYNNHDRILEKHSNLNL